MDESSTTTGTLDQIDEDMLTYTLSDEALEAAAGTLSIITSSYVACTLNPYNCR